MILTCRLYQEKDQQGLLQLWEKETNWGSLPPEYGQWFLRDNPCEGSFIVVAVDETERILGEFIFVSSLVYINAREVRAYRAFAPIVSKTASEAHRSGDPSRHPVVAMYRHAVMEIRARGAGLIFMVPDPRWLRFFSMFPNLQCGSFPLWSLPLPLTEPLPLGDGYTAGPFEVWDQRADLCWKTDQRVDRLWEAAVRLHSCSVVRDSRILPWKIGTGFFNVTAVERNGEMVGLVASRKKGDRQWLVCDMLAADEDSLRATLAAVCNVAHSQAVAAEDPEDRIRKVAVLTTPVIEPAACSLGFVRDDYNFPLVVNVLDPAIAKEDVAPARWYISAND